MVTDLDWGCVCMCVVDLYSLHKKMWLFTCKDVIERHDRRQAGWRDSMAKVQILRCTEQTQGRWRALWQNCKCVWSDMIVGHVAGKVGWIWNTMSSHLLLDSRVRPSMLKNWTVNALQRMESPQMRTQRVSKCSSVLETCSSDLVNEAKKI